mmetsp:Transcript_58801/g.137306  ORF Transcript_58801/g.137306 Transcript_58801/m.137306 type:complete len:206 (-) Transcript_58801:1007-1624(-)
MTPNLRDVMQSTNRESEELSVQSSCYALAYGCLANARWTNQTHDLALYSSLQEAHSRVLKNALLDIFKAVVVLIEYPLCFGNVLVFFRELPPWQASQPLQVVPADVVFRGTLLQCTELRQLIFDDLACLVWHGFSLQGVAELLDHSLLLILLYTQFLHDLPHLFMQHQQPLLFRHLFLHLVLDQGLLFGKLQIFLYNSSHLLQPC